MNPLILEKVASLLLLIGIGYLLKPKFSAPNSTAVLRTFILTAALPATIFLSTIEINTNLDLFLLPTFALCVNFYLLILGILFTPLVLEKNRIPQARSLILMFPSLAPGLTVYPFIEQFVGKQGLAWAALADMGNKFFVLIGLYVFAYLWVARSHQQNSKIQWAELSKFLIAEPVNIAIVLGMILATFGLNAETLPVVLVSTIQKIAICSTPMILLYVGISLKLKLSQASQILAILLGRAGAGFLLSGCAIALLQPGSIEATALFVALPQASCSLWALLHISKINELSDEPFFDLDFATAMLAMSMPFSVITLLCVFSADRFFYSPIHLNMAGTFCLGVFLLFIAVRKIIGSR
jgi:malate permease and related proteins